MTRPILAGAAIFVGWTAVDLFLHRVFLAPIYEANAALFIPFARMNAALIYLATFALIGVYVGAYVWLVRPKSLAAGFGLGALLGFALGVAVGFGTFIHMPIPLALAWGWFAGAWLKGLIAGGLVGVLVVDR
jgi:hypothetical protein